MNDHIQSICKCGHMESMHRGLRSFKDGGIPPLKSLQCRTSNCDCKEFIFDKKICIYCSVEAQPSQYAKKIDTKYEDDLVCRNYPNCKKAEKEF